MPSKRVCFSGLNYFRVFSFLFLAFNPYHPPTPPAEPRNVTFGYVKTVTKQLDLQELLNYAERTMSYIIKCAAAVTGFQHTIHVQTSHWGI